MSCVVIEDGLCFIFLVMCNISRLWTVAYNG